MYSVHKSGRLATPGIKKADLEEAVGIALMTRQGNPGDSVWIENLSTGEVYRGDAIDELQKHFEKM